MGTFYDAIDIYNKDGIKEKGLRKCKNIKENGIACESILFMKDVNGNVVCAECGKEVEE